MAEVLFNFVINENGCFNCVGRALDKDGYPRCKLNGKTSSAARFVYHKIHGEIPAGKVIRHKCDNPLCINPLHLEIGSQYENVKDRDKRKRTAKGSCNGRSKLTFDEAKSIKNNNVLSNSKLAKIYGISEKTVSDIKGGKLWKDIDSISV